MTHHRWRFKQRYPKSDPRYMTVTCQMCSAGFEQYGDNWPTRSGLAVRQIPYNCNESAVQVILNN